MKTKKIVEINALNPGSPPDIDSDIAPEFRADVVEYLRETYGENNVASIGTRGKMKAKSALNDTCRIYRIPQEIALRASNLIPEDLKVTLSSLIDPSSEFYESGAEFRDFIVSNGMEEILNSAIKLEGRMRSVSIHACGLIISPVDISQYAPLKRQQTSKKTVETVTQWQYPELENLGFIKMDLLSLDTVSQIMYTVARIIKGGKTPPNMDKLIEGEMDDPEVYKLFSDGHTVGVFQFSSDMIIKLLKFAKPTSFLDLPALTSLGRPGPMGMDSHNIYARRKNGIEASEPLHKEFLGTAVEKILGETYNVIVYQEQVMQIANQIAGFSLAEADYLRKAMGKKKKDLMESMKAKFFDGALANGFSEEAISVLWETIEKFASYGFNKCLHGETTVITLNGEKTVAELFKEHEKLPADSDLHILSMWEDGSVRPHKVKSVVRTGKKPLWTIKTKSGKEIKVTKEHRLLTTSGYGSIESGEIRQGAELVIGTSTDYSFEKAYKNKALNHLEEALEVSNENMSTRLSNGRVCSSVHEFSAGEYFISRGVDFILHKEIENSEGSTSSFYANGIHFEMDGMSLGKNYFIVNKYGEVPFVYMTPLDYKDKIDEALIRHSFSSGDVITSIEPPEVDARGAERVEMSYDIEMEDDGPSNFIANGIVSHNSHAVAYATLSYQSAWLKVHYPKEFMSAVVTQNIGKKDKIYELLKECKRMGLNVRHADINASDVEMSPDYSGKTDDILLGFTSISAVNSDSAQTIVDERLENGDYKSVEDTVKRCLKRNSGLSRTVFENLAKAGAFDNLCNNRKAIVESLPEIIRTAKKEEKTLATKGESLFDLFSDPNDSVDSVAKVDLSILDYKYTERLRLENEVAGIMLSGNPMDNLREEFKKNTLSNAKTLRKSSEVAVFVSKKDGLKKSGRKFIEISDGKDFVEATFNKEMNARLAKQMAKHDIKDSLSNGKPVKDMVFDRVLKPIADLPEIEIGEVYLAKIKYNSFSDKFTLEDLKRVDVDSSGNLPFRVRFDGKVDDNLRISSIKGFSEMDDVPSIEGSNFKDLGLKALFEEESKNEEGVQLYGTFLYSDSLISYPYYSDAVYVKARQLNKDKEYRFPLPGELTNADFAQPDNPKRVKEEYRYIFMASNSVDVDKDFYNKLNYVPLLYNGKPVKVRDLGKFQVEVNSAGVDPDFWDLGFID